MARDEAAGEQGTRPESQPAPDNYVTPMMRVTYVGVMSDDPSSNATVECCGVAHEAINTLDRPPTHEQASLKQTSPASRA